MAMCIHCGFKNTLQNVSSTKYRIEFYKAKGKKSEYISIRNKATKSNEITFGGDRRLGESALRGFADDCLRQLNEGSTVKKVTTWLTGQDLI